MKKLKSEDKGLFRNVCTCQVGMGIAMTMIGAVLPSDPPENTGWITASAA